LGFKNPTKLRILTDLQPHNILPKIALTPEEIPQELMQNVLLQKQNTSLVCFLKTKQFYSEGAKFANKKYSGFS